MPIQGVFDRTLSHRRLSEPAPPPPPLSLRYVRNDKEQEKIMLRTTEWSHDVVCKKSGDGIADYKL